MCRALQTDPSRGLHFHYLRHSTYIGEYWECSTKTFLTCMCFNLNHDNCIQNTIVYISFILPSYVVSLWTSSLRAGTKLIGLNIRYMTYPLNREEDYAFYSHLYTIIFMSQDLYRHNFMNSMALSSLNWEIKFTALHTFCLCKERRNGVGVMVAEK